MLVFSLGLGVAGALVMVIVTIPATRDGRGPWTWWARNKAERARRLAQRPVPTAEERFARGLSLRRVVGAVLPALPRRRRRREARFVEVDTHRSVGQASASAWAGQQEAPGRAVQGAVSGGEAAGAAGDAEPGEAAAPDGPAPERSLREKVDERAYVAQVEAQTDRANEMVVMIKKRIPAPEVIEADPIDTDIVNPRILSRSR